MPDLLDKLCLHSSNSTFGHGFNVNHTVAVYAWKIPWMREPGGLQSMGLLRVGHG